MSTTTDPTAAELSALHDALVARAAAEDLLDVAYRTVDSPLGTLLVAATPVGIVRIAFEREGHDAVLSTLAERVSPRILAAAAGTEAVVRQLDEYFAGDRRTFDVAVDLRLVDGFRRTVVGRLPDIDYGSTWSYAEVAAAAGNPNAVRAVGSACAHNPVPLVIPCHRVIRSDGTLGGYLGGPDAKATLLALEGAN